MKDWIRIATIAAHVAREGYKINLSEHEMMYCENGTNVMVMEKN